VRLRVGPTRSAIRDRYLIPAFRPAPSQRAHASESLRSPRSANSALIVRAVLCHWWKTDISLHSPKDTCDEDLMGQAPRLWNCLPAAATESYIRDTTDSLETPLHERSSTTESQGMEGTSSSVYTRDWYLKLTVTQSNRRTRTHTHTPQEEGRLRLADVMAPSSNGHCRHRLCRRRRPP
jgi:hypothetical protein